MEENSPIQEPKKRTFNKKISRGLMVLVLLLLAVVAVYFYTQYQNTKNLLQNPNQASSEETKNLLNQVGKLIELPNEQPQIANVSDVSKLSNQPFFKNAQNGDKVLIYSNAKKVILYRPSINKIIEVALVNIGANNQPNTNPTVSATVSSILTPTVTPAASKKLTPTP